MNLLDTLQQFVSGLLISLGLAVQVPGFILGALLIVVAYALYRRVSDSDSLGARIGAAVLATVGVPILFVSLGVGATDALLWGLIVLAIAAFWLTGYKGKWVTIVGILIGILTILAVIKISSTAPAGSVVASGVKTVTDQIGLTWSALISHK
jgi:4-amino-4-deoxy-L-arabinose transferase-like glycosyltransferase